MLKVKNVTKLEWKKVYMSPKRVSRVLKSSHMYQESRNSKEPGGQIWDTQIGIFFFILKEKNLSARAHASGKMIIKTIENSRAQLIIAAGVNYLGLCTPANQREQEVAQRAY